MATQVCPCGYYTHPGRSCRCSPLQIEKYLSRISGPVTDRIDIHIEVPAVPLAELRSQREGTSSAMLREIVLTTREKQRVRFGNDSTMTNARMSSKKLREHCRIDMAGEVALSRAMSELGLSARAHDKILRVSRTIADLAGEESITTEHLFEAIHYRSLDRRM